MIGIFLLLKLLVAAVPPAGAVAADPVGATSAFFCDLVGTVSGKLPSAYLSNTVLMGSGSLHCASKLGVRDFSVSLIVQDGSGSKNFTVVSDAPVSALHIGPLAVPEDIFGEYSLATGASGLIATRSISGFSFSLGAVTGPSLQQALLEIQPR